MSGPAAPGAAAGGARVREPAARAGELLVVIVCFRAADLVVDCLRSLAPEVAAHPRVRVAICENGTGAEAVQEIRGAIEREGWGAWTQLTVIAPNRGFAGGNNAILRPVLEGREPPPLFLLLNADTIVRPGALGALLDAAARHPEAGVIGPRLEWPDGTPQESCFRDFRPLDAFVQAAATGPIARLVGRASVALPVRDEPFTCDWVSFACALIRREVFERVGVLDDHFYLYFDDPDFCRRARGAGFGVLHWPAARVVHLRGRSNPVKSLGAERKRRPVYWYESRARYYAKYYGRAGLWLANALWWAGRPISWVRERVGGRPRVACEREWLDIWTNWRDPLRPPRGRQSPSTG
jgi:hypothetical protein